MTTVARTAKESEFETVDGHTLLYVERVSPEGTTSSRKETRALLGLLEKTRQLIESEDEIVAE